MPRVCVPGFSPARLLDAGTVGPAAVAAAVVSRPGDAVGDPESTVSRSGCRTGWSDPEPGPQTFRLHNTGSVTTEVNLIDPATGVIHGEVEGPGPATTYPLRVDLGNGGYAFRCPPEDSGAIVGPFRRPQAGKVTLDPKTGAVVYH